MKINFELLMVHLLFGILLEYKNCLTMRLRSGESQNQQNANSHLMSSIEFTLSKKSHNLNMENMNPIESTIIHETLNDKIDENQVELAKKHSSNQITNDENLAYNENQERSLLKKMKLKYMLNAKDNKAHTIINRKAHNKNSYSSKQAFKANIEKNNKNLEEEISNSAESIQGECKLRLTEMEFDIPNCGRILINTTMCDGSCKSNEQIIANTKLKKRTCWACKANAIGKITTQIQCADNSVISLRIAAVKSCSCFKHFERII
jgi:hypothetical protein